MERNKTANPIIFFRGNVSKEKLEDFVKLIPNDSNEEVDIIICGTLILDMDVECPHVLRIPANLWADGIDIVDCYCTEIRIDGDFHCKGSINSMKMAVARDFLCSGDIDSCDIEVGGDADCQANVHTNGGKFKTLGDFSCYGKCDSKVEVGRFFLCEGEFTGDVKKI